MKYIYFFLFLISSILSAKSQNICDLKKVLHCIAKNDFLQSKMLIPEDSVIMFATEFIVTKTDTFYTGSIKVDENSGYTIHPIGDFNDYWVNIDTMIYLDSCVLVKIHTCSINLINDRNYFYCDVIFRSDLKDCYILNFQSKTYIDPFPNAGRKKIDEMSIEDEIIEKYFEKYGYGYIDCGDR